MLSDTYYADYHLTGRPYLPPASRELLQQAGRERVIESVCRLLAAGKVAASTVCEMYHGLMEEVES
jgi:hypothetical protein